MLSDADRRGLGILLYAPGDDRAGRSGPIHLVLERPADGWEIGLDLGGADLALLVAYELKRNRKQGLVLTARLQHDVEREQALAYLKSVAELVRISDAQLRAAGPTDADGELAPAIMILTLRLPADFSPSESRQAEPQARVSSHRTRAERTLSRE